MSEDFYMVLPSNSCPNVHPENNAASYTVTLEKPIILNDGQWEMGLIEFNMPYLRYVIAPEDGIRLHHFNEPDQHAPFYIVEFIIKEIPQYAETIINPYAIFTTTSSFVFNRYDVTLGHNEFNFFDEIRAVRYEKILLKQKKLTENTFDLIFYNKRDFSIHFYSMHDAKLLGFNHLQVHSIYEEENDDLVRMYKVKAQNITFVSGGRIFLKVIFVPLAGTILRKREVYIDKYVPLSTADDLMHFMNSFFGSMIGTFRLTNAKCITISFRREIESIDFLGNMKTIIGSQKDSYKVKRNEHFVCENVPKLESLFIPQVYIHTNIVRPVNIGGNLLSVLSYIYFDTKNQQAGHCENLRKVIRYPMYVSLSENVISRIDISVRSSNNYLIQHAPGTVTSISVHVRKRSSL